MFFCFNVWDYFQLGLVVQNLLFIYLFEYIHSCFAPERRFIYNLSNGPYPTLIITFLKTILVLTVMLRKRGYSMLESFSFEPNLYVNQDSKYTFKSTYHGCKYGSKIEPFSAEYWWVFNLWSWALVRRDIFLQCFYVLRVSFSKKQMK